MSKPNFHRLYVWEWPVRIYHWATAAAMLVLAGSGLLIGAPVALQTTREAYANYWFGTVRYLHFAAAWIFFWMFVLRMYWMFAGNRFSNWRVFVPAGQFRTFFRNLWDVIRTDILEVVVRPLDFVGHNPLAAMSYSGVFLLSVFQIATGFALYAPMSSSRIPQLFLWVTPLFGSDATMRLWHHGATWAFVVFVIIHVYLVMYHEVVEASGEVSSMVGGSRFVEHHADTHR